MQKPQTEPHINWDNVTAIEPSNGYDFHIALMTQSGLSQPGPEKLSSQVSIKSQSNDPLCGCG